jgi:hypothetical protein
LPRALFVLPTLILLLLPRALFVLPIPILLLLLSALLILPTLILLLLPRALFVLLTPILLLSGVLLILPTLILLLLPRALFVLPTPILVLLLSSLLILPTLILLLLLPPLVLLLLIFVLVLRIDWRCDSQKQQQSCCSYKPHMNFLHNGSSPAAQPPAVLTPVWTLRLRGTIQPFVYPKFRKRVTLMLAQRKQPTLLHKPSRRKLGTAGAITSWRYRRNWAFIDASCTTGEVNGRLGKASDRHPGVGGNRVSARKSASRRGRDFGQDR